jgi:flagellar basal-body rod protein FlgC
VSDVLNFFKSFAISGSGLTAERLRLDLISNNIANINTIRTSEGGPYRREVPVFAQRLERACQGFQGAGVQVTAVLKDPSPPRMVHDPRHPDANAEGFVAYPNVDINREFIDLISASRAYEANAAALDAAKKIAQHALEMGRG